MTSLSSAVSVCGVLAGQQEAAGTAGVQGGSPGHVGDHNSYTRPEGRAQLIADALRVGAVDLNRRSYDLRENDRPHSRAAGVVIHLEPPAGVWSQLVHRAPTSDSQPLRTEAESITLTRSLSDSPSSQSSRDSCQPGSYRNGHACRQALKPHVRALRRGYGSLA
jgi:hypothetical protein